MSAPEAYFPAESVKLIKAARQARSREGKLVKATAKLVDVFIKGDATKAKAEEEKVLKVKRDAEAQRLKAEVAQRKREEAAAKKEAAALKKREKEAAKAAKQNASPKKPAKAKVSNASKSVMAGFLSKAPKRDSTESRKAPPPKPAEVSTAKTVALLDALEKARAAPPPLEDLRAELRRTRAAEEEPEVQILEPRRGFFAFHTDFGPPRRKEVTRSAVVTATNPFARDPAVDYDYDSDEERYANEGLVEDGEDLSDGEDLEDEDDGELDNEDGFFCGDDDEGGPAQRAALERIQDHQRDQLLGEVVGPVIVGAVAHHGRQPIGVVPGAHEMVRRCLGGGVRRVGLVGGGLGEQAFRPQRAEDLVGRDVVEPKGLATAFGQSAPIGKHLLEQRVGPDDVGLDERAGAVDRAIDVALGRQMHHDIGPEAFDGGLDRRRVADIGLDEMVARVG